VRRRFLTTDGFIQVGFWSQLVLLALVDAGSLASFAKETPPWYHVVGFGVMNTVLLGATWVMWRWIRVQSSSPVK
jgi:hypothetical protein